MRGCLRLLIDISSASIRYPLIFVTCVRTCSEYKYLILLVTLRKLIATAITPALCLALFSHLKGGTRIRSRGPSRRSWGT